MIRLPAVADRFYPGNGTTLDQNLDNLIPTDRAFPGNKAYAVVSPHAGYMFSGNIAGKTLSSIEIPETVLLIGPNHHGQGSPISLSTASWQTPLGIVPRSDEFANNLLQISSLITADDLAHKQEHSLEVQIPFLQKLQPQLQIAALALFPLDYRTCEILATSIASAIANSQQDILILASSDMSHYKSRKIASKMDHMALDQIINMDPEGLYDVVRKNSISMCGIIPVTIALKAAMILGATKSELTGYTDSGEATGDTAQVVGYAGLIIS
jgi:MEMO1 family protein